MSTSLYYSGQVPLKPDVTAEQIAEVYKTITEAEQVDVAPLGYMPGEAINDEWFGTSVDMSVINGFFTYTIDFDGNGSRTWGDDFEDFLDAVATQFAAKGWISYEGHEPDQSQEPRGPNEIAKALAMLDARTVDLAAAVSAHGVAVKDFVKAVADATPL